MSFPVQPAPGFAASAKAGHRAPSAPALHAAFIGTVVCTVVFHSIPAVSCDVSCKSRSDVEYRLVPLNLSGDQHALQSPRARGISSQHLSSLSCCPTAFQAGLPVKEYPARHRAYQNAAAVVFSRPSKAQYFCAPRETRGDILQLHGHLLPRRSSYLLTSRHQRLLRLEALQAPAEELP